MAATARIEINPRVMLGKPVIRGTRIPVELLLRKLSEGATHEDLLDAYRFTTGRDSSGPLEVLESYAGFVHKDGYTGYDAGMKKGGATYVACWAHTRRKFFDALKGGATAAARMIALIARLYAIEDAARELDDAKRRGLRRARSVPILLRIEEEAERQRPRFTPSSHMGEALTYLKNQGPGLKRYLENGMLAIDNNVAERMIKPVALGRRNWLFAGSEDGGHRAAACYTLINSCKLLRIDPFVYVRDVLERVGSHPMSRVAELTPKRWQAARDATR